MDLNNTPYPLNVEFNTQDNHVMDSGNPGIVTTTTTRSDTPANRSSGGGGSYGGNNFTPFWNNSMYTMHTSQPLFNPNVMPTLPNTIIPHNPSFVSEEDILRQRALHSAPKSGTWVFNRMTENIELISKDGTPITDFSDRIAIARSRQDSSYLTAMQALTEHFQHSIKLEFQSELENAHSEIRNLEEKLQKVSRDRARSRSPLRSRREERRPRRSPSPVLRKNRTLPIEAFSSQPIIGHDILDPDPLPRNEETLYTCLHNLHRRPGHPEDSANVGWDIRLTGRLCAPSNIVAIVADRLPPPTPLPIPDGAIPVERRSIPTTIDEFNQWVAQSRIPGNWAALDRIRDMVKVLNVYRHLESKFRRTTLSDIEKTAFNVLLCTPRWAEFDSFAQPRDSCRTTDTKDNWERNPCVVPRVPTSSTLTGTAEHSYLHDRPIARLGVRMTDSGYYDANSFQALLIYNKIKPRPSSPDGKPTADDRRLSNRF
ncbi:hypothetical protein K435DRAFT_880442, partial [Dendrothele bispora CBS 962.96]